MWHATVIGHSFVSRAFSFLSNNEEGSNLNLKLQDIIIEWSGYSGLTAHQLKSKVIEASQPNIVIIEVGSNDLCDPQCDYICLAQEVFNIAI